jgi:hypothetical protein
VGKVGQGGGAQEGGVLELQEHEVIGVGPGEGAIRLGEGGGDVAGAQGLVA